MEIDERVDVTVSETDDRITITLHGARGTISAGGEGLDGCLFLRGQDGGEHIRLDGRAGSILTGGNGSAGRLFLRKTVSRGGRSADHVTMSLDGSRGNIRAGSNGCDGDLLLFPESATDIDDDTRATAWIDSGNGNMALGGNDRDGDLLLFPGSATISTTEAGPANVWLDGERGDIRFAGALAPKSPSVSHEQLSDYSTDEGAVSSFRGSGRFGIVDFTYEHRAVPGDRDKLRNIHVFNPTLHDRSIVLVTAHAGGPCVADVGFLDRPDASGGEGRFIDIHMIRKLSPGRRVRVVYWILN